jgi:hypothetical protein
MDPVIIPPDPGVKTFISLRLKVFHHHIGRLLAPGRGTARELQFTSRFLFQGKNKSPLPAGFTSSILKGIAGMGGRGDGLNGQYRIPAEWNIPAVQKEKSPKRGSGIRASG